MSKELGLFTTKTFKQGEVLFVEAPLVSVLSHSKVNHCGYCLAFLEAPAIEINGETVSEAEAEKIRREYPQVYNYYY